jgi:hypothetical protein
MKRNLSVERLFPLGDFKNIKFTSELENIPEEFATNEKAVGLLWLQMAYGCDIAYVKYYNLIESLAKTGIKEKLARLEEERQNVINELNKEYLSEKKPLPAIEVKSETTEKETE